MPQPSGKSIEPFVGREPELEKMKGLLQAVLEDRRPKFLLIEGELGVGKTTLVKQFLLSVTKQHTSALLCSGKCSLETENNGLMPFYLLLEDLVEKVEEAEPIRKGILEVMKRIAPSSIDLALANIPSAISKTLKEAAILGRFGTFSQPSWFIQFSDFIEHIACTKPPLVIFIEDLHWADESSLQLLFHLFRDVNERSLPLMFIGTYRPGDVQFRPNASTFHTVEANMSRYGAERLAIPGGISVEEYIRQRYEPNAFSKDLIDDLQKKTDGHPLFLSQLLTLWEEMGTIRLMPAKGGRTAWNISGQFTPTIPLSLAKVLDERLEALNKELRMVLNVASVEGETFTDLVLICRQRKIGHQSEAEDITYDALSKLSETYQLIRPLGLRKIDSLAFDTYQFMQRFFHTHIYEKLLAGQRLALHRQVADCIEKLFEENVEDKHPVAAQLARHFSKAGQALRAAQYAYMAARYEHTRFAWSESQQWSDFGLTQLDELTPNEEKEESVQALKLSLFEQSGDSWTEAGEFSFAYEMYREARDMAAKINIDAVKIARLYYKLAYVCRQIDAVDETLEFIEEGQRLLSKDDISHGEILLALNVQRGFMHLRQGQLQAASDALNALLRQCETLPLTDDLQHTKAYANLYLAVTLSYLNDYEGAPTNHEECARIAESIDWKWMQAMNLLDWADNEAKRGKLKASEKLLVRATKVITPLGNKDLQAYSHAIKGYIFIQMDRPEDAKRELLEAVRLSEGTLAKWNTARMCADLATAYLQLSEIEEAYNQAHTVVDLSETNKRKYGLAYGLMALGRIEGRRGEWSSADATLSRAISLFNEIGHKHFAARAQYYLAQTLLESNAANGRTKAISLLKLSCDTLQSLGLEEELNICKQMLYEAGSQD